uniref:Uncharacterized protein n=1 Tax=Triticum urartu TaxID=4572 RepID=A0A8R7UME0_TRIUA
MWHMRNRSTFIHCLLQHSFSNGVYVLMSGLHDCSSILTSIFRAFSAWEWSQAAEIRVLKVATVGGTPVLDILSTTEFASSSLPALPSMYMREL